MTLRPLRSLALLALATALVAPVLAHDHKPAAPAKPTLIAHRGASGYVPEHTLAAYWLAIEQGADFVEPDLVITKDGVLVARHENAIAILNADGSVREATTDVVDRPEFAARKTTKTIDGVANTRFDGQFEIPTFEEVLQLVARANEARKEEARREGGRRWNRDYQPIGVYPETKHPSFFQSIGKPLEQPLVKLLNRYGYVGKNAPVIIQSFETQNLRQLSRMTRVPIAQLLNGSGKPYDFVLSGDPRTYADLAKPAGLADIATYANGIGANTNLMIPLVGGRLGTPTTLVADAHAAGLIVHGWTFRAENTFLPNEFDAGTDPTALGDLEGQIHAFLKLGMDGFFTDQPFLGRKAIDSFKP